MGRKKPHKLVMLLAVIDLFEEGYISQNRIYFDEKLINQFVINFKVYSVDGYDWCQPGPPFFHLRQSGFWFHEIVPGKEKEYKLLTTSGGGKKTILETIEYAYLSDDAYMIMMCPKMRDNLRLFIDSILIDEIRGG
ncbi:hypothetical protein [Kallotenue papyrolyticum]|uniref:hypothetical protein n=1 Tax=Kallotenue papyrolyticum TaxID=1325125 RepID=UPI0012690D4E|nr:hypothetical protein [Kallotenue papyrolyticum]